MCSYLTGAGAQAAPSRPRPPPLRKFGEDGRANGSLAASRESTTPALARRLEIAANVAGGSLVTFRVPRRVWFKAKTAFRMGGLKRRENHEPINPQRQPGVTGLLYRHSGCRAGQRNASRNPNAGEQSNVANGLDAFTWRHKLLGDIPGCR